MKNRFTIRFVRIDIKLLFVINMIISLNVNAEQLSDKIFIEKGKSSNQSTLSMQYNDTIYVSPKGSDANSGTNENPLATLYGARMKIRKIKTDRPGANFTVLMHKGYYQLDRTFTLSLEDGTDGKAIITYESYPGEKAIIGSGIKLANWSLVDGNLPNLPKVALGHVYETDMPNLIVDFFTMYDNETRVPRAISQGLETPLPNVKRYKNDSTFLNRLVCPPGILRNWNNPNDVEAIVIPNFPWTMNILKIASVDMVKNTAFTMLPSTYPMRQVVDYRKISPNLWLENAIDFLDKPGEWVVDTKKRKIWYWPKSGSPNDDIRIPQLATLIKIEGQTNINGPTDVPVKGIVFKNLVFMHADRGLWNKNDRGIQHDWAMVDKDDALVRFRGAANCKVINCEFINSGGNGIRLDYSCQNIKIEGNEFHDLGQSAVLCIGYGAGIKNTNKNNYIFNNDIHDCGQIKWDSPMIALWQSGSNIVLNNFIHDVPRQAIIISGPRYSYFFSKENSNPRQYRKSIRWNDVKFPGRDYAYYVPFLHGDSNVIENNEIRNAMTKLGDGAAINISGAGSGNIVRHNLIYDINNVFADAVLRTDDYQDGSIFENNIVFHSKIPGAVVKGENIFRNNYFINLVTKYSVPWGGVFGNVEAYAHQSLDYGHSVWTQNVFYSDTPTENKKFYASKTVGDEYKNVSWDFNIYYMKGVALKNQAYNMLLRASGKDLHSLYIDPKFKDIKNFDFSVAIDSPIFKVGIRPVSSNGIGLTSDFPKRFHPARSKCLETY